MGFEMTQVTISMDVWEKSIILDLLKEAKYDCMNDIDNNRRQIIIKKDKEQWDRVRDYERSIAETEGLIKIYRSLIVRFEDAV